MNNDEIVEKIKGLAKLEDIIQQDGYRLAHKGRGEFQGIDHDSLKVSSNVGLYKWYSKMDEHQGSVVDWMMAEHGMDFKTAVEELYRRCNQPFPGWQGGGDPGSQAEREGRKRKGEVFQVAQEMMAQWLWESREALEYVRGRGLTDETIRRETPKPNGGKIHGAGLGYTGGYDERAQKTEAMKGALLAAGVDLECPEAVAIVGYKGNVREWAAAHGITEFPARWTEHGYIPGMVGMGCIVFPYVVRGTVVYLAGRSIVDKEHHYLPKELAGGKQRYYNQVWNSKADAVVIVEGQMDAITLGQWGVGAVALGGSDAGSDVVPIVADIRTVYIGVDNDKTGKALRDVLGDYLGPMRRIVKWEEGAPLHDIKDANDLLKAWCGLLEPVLAIDAADQAKKISELLDGSLTVVEQVCHMAGYLKGAKRDDAIADALAMVARMDDKDRPTYRKRLADALDVTVREFDHMLKKAIELNAKSGDDGLQVVPTLGGWIDGWLLEYLYDADAHKAALAWRNPEGRVDQSESVVIGTKRYVPVEPTQTFKDGGVLFPSKLGPLKGTRELVSQIELFIRSVYLLSKPVDGKIMAYYVLLTWMYDCFNTIPYLRAMGEAGAGKSELLRRIGIICYRMLSANGAGTVASLFRSVERYRGTVFIDEMDLRDSDASNEIIKFMNLGAMRNNPIWRLEEVTGPDGKKEYTEKMYQTFCPKLIAMRKDFHDDAVGSRCITFMIQPRDITELLAAGITLEINSEIRGRALAIRNIMLRWRMEHYEPEIKINPDFYEVNISSRLNQVTGPLMAMAKDDPALQAEIRKFLREYYAEMVLSKSMTLVARVIESLWKIKRYPDLNKAMVLVDAENNHKILIGDVTRIANEIMDEMNGGSDETDDSGKDNGKNNSKQKKELQPHAVGRMIREDLQLRVSERTTKGYYVIWDEPRLMGLAKRYGVDVESIGAAKAAAAPRQAVGDPKTDADPTGTPPAQGKLIP